MKFLEVLEETLKQDSRFVGEGGRILKAKVYDACMNMDEPLLGSLLNNDILKSHFFVEVNGTLVFDKMKFAWVLESKEFLPDSYTMFKNKIGLANKSGDLLSQKNDVVLVWPYKDCVLEGGQTKEDQKRDEIFYNETLAPDEVTRLLHPKVLTNAKRYSKNKVEEVVEIENTDNLIIKGNNLLALASLLKRYEGKVKCIYIDPPYNTGSDSFNYNDSFNHSSWLTFMKSRLKIAKKLLSDTGSLWISIDEKRVHYLKMILDELFGKKNFIIMTTIQRGGPTGHKAINPTPVQVCDFMLTYAKNKSAWVYQPVYRSRGIDKAYNQYIENYEKGYKHWGFIPLKEAMRKYEFSYKKNFAQHAGRIIRFAQPDYKGVGQTIRNLIDISKQNDKIYLQTRKDYPDIYLYKGNRILFYKDKLKEIDGIFTTAELVTNLWDDMNYQGIAKEGGVTFTRSKKPEAQVKRVLEMSTKSGDLVLDCFLGSGTTAAVAHKMGRQYICIEQMDYINTITIPRLRRVIEGEQTGISKVAKWEGGGSFVYCELMEQNESIASALQAADTSEEVEAILNQITEDGLIIPSVLPDDLRAHRGEFIQMPLEQQKKLVMELIDKNKLYVNLCDMDDEELAVSGIDKTFTRSFYRLDERGGV